MLSLFAKDLCTLNKIVTLCEYHKKLKHHCQKYDIQFWLAMIYCINISIMSYLKCMVQISMAGLKL